MFLTLAIETKKKKRPAEKSFPYIGIIEELNGEYIYIEGKKRAREDV
ncbi:hypothetical protein [Metamycoplasma auris]|nr:hypothetical protein [Metamycoplasma auris]